MTSFESNYKRTLTILVGVGFIAICIFASVLEYHFQNPITSVLLLFLSLGLFYFLFFMLPREIIIHKNELCFKSSLKMRRIALNEIKSIKAIYSTKSLLFNGGDKNKTPMVCIITFDRYASGFLLFDSQLKNYKELFSLIERKLKSEI